MQDAAPSSDGKQNLRMAPLVSGNDILGGSDDSCYYGLGVSFEIRSKAYMTVQSFSACTRQYDAVEHPKHVAIF